MLINWEPASLFHSEVPPWLRPQSPLQLNRLDLTELRDDMTRLGLFIIPAVSQSSLQNGDSTSPFQCLLEMAWIDQA